MKTTQRQRHEVLNQLAELERSFFHLTQNPEGLPFEEVSTIYENIKNALITWHQINKK